MENQKLYRLMTRRYDRRIQKFRAESIRVDWRKRRSNELLDEHISKILGQPPVCWLTAKLECNLCGEESTCHIAHARFVTVPEEVDTLL